MDKHLSINHLKQVNLSLKSPRGDTAKRAIKGENWKNPKMRFISCGVKSPSERQEAYKAKDGSLLWG